MAEVKSIADRQPHVAVDRMDSSRVMAVSEIRGIASGKISIAEYEDPEDVARTLACIALDIVNGN